MIAEESAQIDDLIRRLNKIEGQVRGIQRLIVARANPEKVLHQIKASQNALGKISNTQVAKLVENTLGAENDDNAVSGEQMTKIKQIIYKYG
jgi:DNA-binding FrmR family transcriptional regulator